MFLRSCNDSVQITQQYFLHESKVDVAR